MEEQIQRNNSENQESSRVGSIAFSVMVGVIAVLTLAFVIFNPSRLTTFLGGAGAGNEADLTQLEFRPVNIEVRLDAAFEVDVFMVAGREIPENVRAVVSFDPESLQATFVERGELETLAVDAGRSAAATRRNDFFDNENGLIVFDGEVGSSGEMTEGQEVFLGTISFESLDRVGATEIIFVTDDTRAVLSGMAGEIDASSVSGTEPDQDLLGSTNRVRVDVLTRRPEGGI